MTIFCRRPVSLPPVFSANLISAIALAVTASVFAKPVPDNLGNGLNKIVENQLVQQGQIGVPAAPAENNATGPMRLKTRAAKKAVAAASAQFVSNYKEALAKQAASFSKLAIIDAKSGKYLVDIMPDGQVPVATLQSALQTAFPAIEIRHIDTKYAGHGVLEGFITLEDAPNIGRFDGVGSVILQLRPIHSVGAVTAQSINQHRINRINQLYNPNTNKHWDGTGISIGVLSDSFNSQPSAEGGATTAQEDVVTGDLPGGTGANPGPTPSNPNPNTQAVVVLQDYNPVGGATNEGRGMCQVVADMAPMARIGFATADTGEVGFANNIRALGGLAGYTYPDDVQQGFKGDVVCDDVSYLDEPMFQDGIVAQGVIDVVSNGASYCSSAANNWGTDGYDSDLRIVPNGTGLTAAAGNTALAGTNINLTGVDPSLYAGGFHNFNPAPGQKDVAQLFNSASDPQAAVFQWNDPYDTATPTLGPKVFGPVNSDSEPGQPDPSFHVNFTAGQEYVITEHATPMTAADNYDAIVEVDGPNGKAILSQDTGADETVTLFAPVTGSYTIIFHAFATSSPIGGPGVPTRGPFTFQINTANGTPRITQDLNLLFFDTSGKFIEAIASNNIANNRPYEIWVPDLSSHASQVQLVISRANTSAPANAANHFKYVFFGNGITGIGPAEYNNYLTPVTFGHSAAAGANSVAAYAMFRPNLPEDFTSPGPVTIYFDVNNNRLATPQLRLKPDIAAADGANNTFFPLGPAQDAPWDADTQYANFYGTSCASPNAAALCALILQAHGGPGKLTPAQVKTLMQLTAFPHDLDPYFSGATVPAHNGMLSINVISDNDPNTGTGSNDSNAWSAKYTGTGFVKQITFNPLGAAADGGNPTGGNYNGGATPGTFKEYSDYFDPANYRFTPGLVFDSGQYTNGSASNVAGNPTFTNQAPSFPPGSTNFDWTLSVGFAPNAFVAGKTFRFNVGRAQQQDAASPQGMTVENGLFGQPNTYSADMLGSGVLIPEYADNPQVLPGMLFSGIITDAGTDFPFTGRLANQVGAGYSPLDGYGFVNGEAATAAKLPSVGVVSRKIHGPAGAFDISLPLSGPIGLESRAPGPNQSYQLVYTFPAAVQNPGQAGVIQGTAAAATPVLGPGPNQVTVNLTGVANKQHLVVNLSNVRDSVGNPLSSIGAHMDVLVGDVDVSRHIDVGDIARVQQQNSKLLNNNNFRADVDASGHIDVGDIAIVQRNNSTGL
jgi:hypothetical protein